ncbi:hypothetical protein LXL04_000922 [Taraxacum kok-saghyz]
MATAQSCYTHDVFLSFRGEDTRKSFTDHLYTALKQAGIRTFRDDDAMDRGKLLKPELNKAIHESAISLIVFSESYASSKWCLDEVMMIIEEHETSSKHEVIPVFYKVEPSDVRNQTGSFKDAFDGYDAEIKEETDLQNQRELLEKVGAWRDSLRKAATLTGMVLADRYESKFINNIVNVVIKKIDNKALHIEEKLVGIKDHLVEIGSWLQDPSPDAVVLLIDGMGGIGKSTIAKCIFNLNFRKYDGSCFLADINKETSNQNSGLCRLQSQLLSKILKSEKEEIVWNVDEGTTRVTNAISNKKVLLILDDVATKKQLDALLGPQRFYPGSKVIITSRHKDLPASFTYHQPKVHSVRTLSTVDATELFSLHAFHQHQPVESHTVLSQPVVDRCKGLPLALKVLGSSLCEKTIDEWKDTMLKLAAIPHPEIQEVLQISYETMGNDNDKQIFLHICCILEGEQKDYIVKILVGCGLYPGDGIKNLRDRCLLDVVEGRVVMHQSIKEMGREVVRRESEREPGKRSRLWDHQDCIDVLQDHTGTENVEGLILDMPTKTEAKSRRWFKKYFDKSMNGNDANFQMGALEKMSNLMLLQLNNVTFSGKHKLPKKLRLLSWHGYSLKAIPCEFSLEKLVVLHMGWSRLTHVWDGFKIIKSLKILDLSCSRDLIKTPDFDGLPGLEILILRGCVSLVKIDKSIANLKELAFLDLTKCISLRDLRCLPISLKALHMCGCEKLEVIGSIENLTKLKWLNLTNCVSLRVLPCLPTSLTSLGLYGCLKLDVLGSIEKLTKLKWLDLTDCTSTSDLPCLAIPHISHYKYPCGFLGWVQRLDSVSSHFLLTEVNLPHSNLFDNSFPNDWSSMVSLVKLNIDGNNITFLPKCIQTLPSVQELSVAHCSKLQSVLGVPKSVNKLFVHDNKSLVKVQPAQNSRTVVYHKNCQILCEIEGRYKRRSIDMVEKKIIRSLGLESNAGEEMELGLEVFLEFGIFSTFVSEKQIPSSSCFTYNVKASQLSFKVPSHPNSLRIIGFSMCAVLSLSFLQVGLDLEIGVHNKTKDLLWSYFKRDQNIRKDAGIFALLSLWRCGNMLGVGDEITIRVFSRLVGVEECCICLVYEDDKELPDGERKETHHVNGFDQMSWTDRMDKDISRYICPGKKHVFRDDDLSYDEKEQKWERLVISHPYV